MHTEPKTVIPDPIPMFRRDLKSLAGKIFYTNEYRHELHNDKEAQKFGMNHQSREGSEDVASIEIKLRWKITFKQPPAAKYEEM